ncbi:MAG: hypothetical protein ACOH2V_00270 [Candidatus Saccharimonadaceae bacterium]
MNLSMQEKKLFSKLGIILGIIIIVALIFMGINKLVHNYQNKRIEEKQELIRQYQSKIDSVKVVNIQLFKDIQIRDQEIDSLYDVKNKIKWKYDKEISIIYDATPVDNAKWMDAIIQELDHNSR